jgi:hypothetical protein
VEKYGDLITNGLDLLSFLLVTPEIARVITPAASELIGAITTVIVGTVVLSPVVLLLSFGAVWLFPSSKWALSGLIVIVVLVSVGSAYLKGQAVVDWVASRAPKHLFAIGIGLFLLSRLIAFYGSAVKAGLL